MDEQRQVENHGETRARARVEALFAGFDRLTPDELAGIGLRRDHGAARRSQLEVVEAAARSAGRTALLDEARIAARDMVLQRYSAGGLHPTWVGLNWGLSQGTTGDRVAIAQALEDAAAVAVVEDVVDRDVADALSLDAEHVVGLSGGNASEGSLAHAVEPPPPGYRDTRGRHAAIIVAASLVGGLAAFAWTYAGDVTGSVEIAVGVGAASAIVLAGIVLALARR